MAPITWHNIAAPSFRDSILANQAASENFNAAGANLQRILAEQSKIANANFDNQTRIGTEEEIAAMQQAKDLGTLRGQEANFDLGPVRERQGVNADFDKITAVRSALEAKYLEQSKNNVSLAGDTAFNITNSKTSALDAITAAGPGQGLRHIETNNIGGDYLAKQLTPRMTAIEDDNKRRSAEFANEYILGKPLLGTDKSVILGKALEKLGPDFDLKHINQALNETIGGQVAAQTQTRDVVQYDNKLSTDEHVINALNQIGETGDEKAVFDSLSKSDVSPAVKLAVRDGVNKHLEKTDTLNPMESLQLGTINKQYATAYNNLLAQPKANLAALQKKQEVHQVMSDDDYAVSKKKAGDDSPLKVLVDKTGTDGWLGIKTLGSAIVNEEDFVKFIKPLAGSLEKSKFTTDEANKLILGTAKDLIATSETWNGLTSGYNKAEFLTRLIENIQKMATHKSMGISNSNLAATISKAETALSDDLIKKDYEHRRGLITAKRTNGRIPFDGEAVLKGIGKNLPDVGSFDYATPAKADINLVPISETINKLNQPEPKSQKEQILRKAAQLSPVGGIYTAVSGAKTAAESAYELFQKLNK